MCSVFQPHAMIVSCFFAKVVGLKVVHSLKICQHTKFHGPTLTGTIFRNHLRSVKIPPSPYSKAPLRKIMIQIKLVGTSMIFNFSKLRFSKCNGPWVVSIQQNVNFKFQPPAMLVFFVFRKVVLLKVVHPFYVYQYTTFHGPTLTRASFASASEVRSSAFWNG
jgi:hypothetical protein